LRPFVSSLALAIVLLPGVQHGIADWLDARHGLASHCHLVFEHGGPHDHDAHATHHDTHAAPHDHDAHRDTHATSRDHDAHRDTHVSHDHDAHRDPQATAHSDADAHDAAPGVREHLASTDEPRPCSETGHEVPCPHAPLEDGGHHSHAMPPMIPVETSEALASWTEPWRLAFGETLRALNGRATDHGLDRPPRAV
jgi:hypothetical protein